MPDTTVELTLPQVEAGLRGAIEYLDYDLFKALDASRPNEVEEDGDTFTTAVGRFVRAAAVKVEGATVTAPAALTVRVVWVDDEEIVIYLGAEEVSAANHDDHGWDGMRATIATAEGSGPPAGPAGGDRGRP